ncbi:MAG: tetratricopeptide repeat protein [Gammaproteobacteria bacterium]
MNKRYQIIRTIFFSLLAFSCLATNSISFAETSDFSNVTAAIKDSKFDEAAQLVDHILKSEPDNVNALMYKGNILYFSSSNSGAIQLYGNEDESIYESGMGFLGEGSSLVSADVAKQVAIYFKRALQLAPDRVDIQMGLCWIYANAGLKDELISRFPHLKKYNIKEGLQYNMGDYAQIIANEYSLDDGMAVYHAITKLYPHDGNLVSDIGAVYFQKGDLENAVKYFTKAAKMSQRDQMTLANLVLINAVIGDYEKSLHYQERLSQLEKNDMHLLYRALAQRLAGTSDWQKHASEFISRHAEDESNPYKEMAQSLLPDNGKYSFEQYMASTTHKVDTHFDILNAEWAVKTFPEKFAPLFKLADISTYYHNYDKAISLYKRIEQKHLATTQDRIDKLNFYYAWALYSTDHIEDANQRWKQLLNAENFYYKSAACYFLGNYHYKRDEFKKSKSYFSQVKDDASKSKYANYASNMYQRINSNN